MTVRRRIKELVVVEGKCDVSAVKAAVDCDVIATRGFGIFNDGDIARVIRAAAGERGVIALTDSDRAGFRIRARLKQIIGEGRLANAYIPQIQGKEKRKERPSADGNLGVEAMSPQVIIKALEDAGATYCDETASVPAGAGITKADMFALGLSGRDGSAQLRDALLKKLDLPVGINANALLEIINVRFTRDELTAYLKTLE